jgi:hypothetical protein
VNCEWLQKFAWHARSRSKDAARKTAHPGMVYMIARYGIEGYSLQCIFVIAGNDVLICLYHKHA